MATLALADAGASPLMPAQEQPAAALDQTYDIPPQSIALALASFARMSGVDILYENALGSGQTSSSVRGRMSPQAALRALLAGTGLSARFTEPMAAIVYRTAGPASRAAAAKTEGLPELRLGVAEVRAPTMIGAPDRSGYQRYAQAALLDIRALLGRDPALRGRVFRLQLSLQVSPAGVIARAMFPHGSGDDGLDAHIRGLLLGRSLSPPPPDLRAPLDFEVTTDLVRGRG